MCPSLSPLSLVTYVIDATHWVSDHWLGTCTGVGSTATSLIFFSLSKAPWTRDHIQPTVLKRINSFFLLNLFFIRHHQRDSSAAKIFSAVNLARVY